MRKIPHTLFLITFLKWPYFCSGGSLCNGIS